MECIRLTNKYCVCRRCLGNSISMGDCPCKVCNKCFVHMGELHFEHENKLEENICDGCFRINNIKLDCDLRGFGLLVYEVYDRAYSDATSIVEYERDNAMRWIKSESFFYYSNMLGMKKDGLREGMLDRIKVILQKEHKVIN